MMTTLTSSATFTIGAGSVVTVSAAVPILPLIAPGTGMGRLIHPTLGTLDYPNAPDEWVNIDQDVIISPIWSSTKTLAGAVNALWQANLRDVIVEEHWTQDINIRIEFLRSLLAFWQNPPDPVTGTPVQWWPNYTSALGFKVILKNVQVGSGLRNVRERYDGIMLNSISKRTGWVSDAVLVTMLIVGRAP